MPDLIRVACVQLESGADKSANVARAGALVERAAAAGAGIVVLPEKWNGVGTAAQLRALAEPLEGGETVVADLDRARLHRIRDLLPSLAHRQPDAYHPPARA